MPRPRNGRPRVEDAIALRASDLVRGRDDHGPRAFGSADLFDPATGAPAGTASWSVDLFPDYARVTVVQRRAGQARPVAAYTLELTRRAGPLGPRWWLLCPFRGRRAAALFLPAIEARFASREHHGLAYASQGASSHRRAEARAIGIRVALGGSADLAAPFPARPRGMRATTYMRRRAEAEAGSPRTG